MPGKSKSKRASLNILFILFILVAGLIVFMFVKRQAIFSLDSSPKVTPTVNDWKTYKDPMYGYSFLYPMDWGVTGEGSVTLFSNKKYLSEHTDNLQSLKKEDNASISTIVYPYGTDTPAGVVSEQIDIEVFAQNFYDGLEEPEPIIVDGQEGVIFSRVNTKPENEVSITNCTDWGDNCRNQFGYTKQVWVPIRQGFFVIEDDFGTGYKEVGTLNDLFMTVVRSVKFSE